MADNNFFEEPKVEEEAQAQPEAIKLGDKAYTQDELNEAIGIRDMARELETKWDTKLDRVYPEFTKARQELADLRKQAQDQAQVQIEKKEAAGDELSQEEQDAIVRQQLKKFGVITEDEFETKYAERRAGEKMLEQTSAILNKAVQEGKPKATEEDLLTYMVEHGIKDPQDAYDLMFKKEIRSIELEQLRSLKPTGFSTGDGSTAGAKAPEPVRVTRENLGDLLTEVLAREGQ